MALASDTGDVQGGTTKEGIHMGVMAGTLDLLQRAYLGADVRGHVLHFAPRLLDRLQGLVLPMRFQGHAATSGDRGFAAQRLGGDGAD